MTADQSSQGTYHCPYPGCDWEPSRPIDSDVRLTQAVVHHEVKKHREVTRRVVEMSDGQDAAIGREEPYWVVISRVDEDEYATATVDAPTETQAEAEGKRLIAYDKRNEGFEVRNVRGPFPTSPGEAASEVRPPVCHGCGLACWDGDDKPCPHVTWFERGNEDEDSVEWTCIQCSTRTHLPKEVA